MHRRGGRGRRRLWRHGCGRRHIRVDRVRPNTSMELKAMCHRVARNLSRLSPSGSAAGKGRGGGGASTLKACRKAQPCCGRRLRVCECGSGRARHIREVGGRTVRCGPQQFRGMRASWGSTRGARLAPPGFRPHVPAAQAACHGRLTWPAHRAAAPVRLVTPCMVAAACAGLGICPPLTRQVHPRRPRATLAAASPSPPHASPRRPAGPAALTHQVGLCQLDHLPGHAVGHDDRGEAREGQRPCEAQC